MPRELLPQGRKRERGKGAELFPRTEARVLAGPACDRLLRYRGRRERHVVKGRLREMALRGEAAEVEHVTD